MESDARVRATEIVAAVGCSAVAADASARELTPLVYDELRRLARGYMAHERPDHTLQPTALVHEAFLNLVDSSRVDWRGRSHFLALAARAMRRLLIDHARGRGRLKRGGDRRRVTFSDWRVVSAEEGLDPAELLAVDAALDRLAELDQREARIVELRFYAGLAVREIARYLGVSERTVAGDWAHARAWLKRELAGAG